MSTQTKDVITIERKELSEDDRKLNIKLLADVDLAVADLNELVKAKAFGADGDQVYADACQVGKEVARRLEWWNSFVAPAVDAAHKAWKAMTEMRGAVGDPLEAAKKKLAIAAGAYSSAKKNHQEAEARRVQADLEEQRKKELLDRAAAAEKSGDKETAEEVLKEAVAYQAPMTTLPPPPKVKGAAEREDWTFEVVDINLVPRTFLCLDEKMVRSTVKSQKEKTSIPGIRAYAVPKTAFSSK